jgi:hypothetical protein
MIEKMIQEFVDYMLSFYGNEGIYQWVDMKEMEVLDAMVVYFERIRDSDWMEWGNGDSLDRERVRDIVLEMRGKDWMDAD